MKSEVFKTVEYDKDIDSDEWIAPDFADDIAY